MVPCASADCCSYIHSKVIWGIGVLQFKVFATTKFTLLLYMKVELLHLFLVRMTSNNYGNNNFLIFIEHCSSPRSLLCKAQTQVLFSETKELGRTNTGPPFLSLLCYSPKNCPFMKEFRGLCRLVFTQSLREFQLKEISLHICKKWPQLLSHIRTLRKSGGIQGVYSRSLYSLRLIEDMDSISQEEDRNK